MIAWLGCAAAPIFVPAPDLADAPRLRVAVVGDWGQDRATLDHVGDALGAVCAARGCDAVIATGDNLYPRGMQPGLEPVFAGLLARLVGDLGRPVYAVLGNHDWGRGFDRAAADRQIRFAGDSAGRYVLPGPNWSARLGPATVLGLDTTRLFWEGVAPAVAPLRARLRDACGDWRVVVGHHAWWSNGTHGSAGAFEGLPWAPVAAGHGLARLRDEALCGAADVVLSGHDHHREWIEACGTHWIVSGTGASAVPPPGRGIPSRHLASGPGLVWLDLGPDRLDVAFVDVGGTVSWEGSSPRRACPADGAASHPDREAPR